MPPRIDKNDMALLQDLAECRMLTLAQLAFLRSRGEAGLGRRARVLVRESILQTLPVAPDRRRGRPQCRWRSRNAAGGGVKVQHPVPRLWVC